MTSFAIDVPQALIERLKKGDARAYEQLYRLFERPVYTLAWRMLGDADEAREILHDAMLVLIDKLDTFRGESPFWGWLRQVAVNEALQRLRRERRLASELDGVDADATAEDRAPPPPAAASRRCRLCSCRRVVGCSTVRLCANTRHSIT